MTVSTPTSRYYPATRHTCRGGCRNNKHICVILSSSLIHHSRTDEALVTRRLLAVCVGIVQAIWWVSNQSNHPTTTVPSGDDFIGANEPEPDLSTSQMMCVRYPTIGVGNATRHGSPTCDPLRWWANYLESVRTSRIMYADGCR